MIRPGVYYKKLWHSYFIPYHIFSRKDTEVALELGYINLRKTFAFNPWTTTEHGKGTSTLLLTVTVQLYRIKKNGSSC